MAPQRSTCRVLAVAAAAALWAWLPARAQDASSVVGVWSTTLMTPDDPSWRIEDHLCGVCSPSELALLQRMLADPANDSRTLKDLQQEARAEGAERVGATVTEAARERFAAIEQPADASLVCEPPSLFSAALGAPLPLAIDLRDGEVMLHQQHWNVIRAVKVAAESPTARGPPSRYGNATARFEGATLVVESVNLLPIVTSEAVTTEHARVIERYTASADGSRLDLELTIDDPATYREPRTWYRPRIRTPSVQIVRDDPCANLAE